MIYFDLELYIANIFWEYDHYYLSELGAILLFYELYLDEEISYLFYLFLVQSL